jgi:hypothetical protein
VLRWTGEIRSFQFGRDPATSSGLPLSFIGTDADEGVTVSGGPGSDTAQIDTQCVVLTVVVDESATCDGTTGRFTGMEEVLESSNVGGGEVTLIGTNRDERLVAIGDRVVVHGLGGDDVLVDEGWTTRVRGGDGDDRIYVEGDDVVVRGDAGADRIRLDGPLNYYLFGGKPVETRQHLALGGRGPDVLIGSDDEVADRLVGAEAATARMVEKVTATTAPPKSPVAASGPRHLVGPAAARIRDRPDGPPSHCCPPQLGAPPLERRPATHTPRDLVRGHTTRAYVIDVLRVGVMRRASTWECFSANGHASVVRPL